MITRRSSHLGLPALLCVLVAACASPLVACRHSDAAPGERVVVPSGEVWLSAADAKQHGIVTEPAAAHVVDDTLVTSGKVTFDDARVAHVYSPVTGRVTKVGAQLGQHVKKGDPLAWIDSPDIGLASADLHKAEAEMVAAEHDFEREKKMFVEHATSEQKLEMAEDDYRQAKAELARAKQKASLFGGAATGTVTQQYVLRAGIEGDVIARNIAPGAEVQGQYANGAAIELFTVGELNRVWVLADIFEADLERVRARENVSLGVVGFAGKTFTGEVDSVASVLDPITRTARVRCVLDNPDRLLKPEMYATVRISVDERQALSVPRSAILHLGDSTMVFVEIGASADGRVRYERRPVLVDDVEGTPFLPVSHGLTLGDRVVTAGAELLSGML
jgi:cobalt-zinc-cadmium efflux system membrane fusion protein